MIINQESHIRKTLPDPESNVPVATSSTPLIPDESPPVYTPREDSTPYFNPPSALGTQKRAPNPAAQRFFKALILAFCLYFAIMSFFKLLFEIRRPPPHDHHPIVGYPEPEDGRIVNCILGGDYPWPPSTTVRFPSFGIPLDSGAISVLARGKQATGSVRVELDQTSGKDEITVDVAARYHDWDIVKGTTVCLMEKGKGELGVGVFTPNRLTWTNRRTEFEIVVKLPHQSGSPVLRVPRLEILTPDFSVAIPGADKFVHFHNLTIHTSGMPVVVDPVKATYIDIQTSNAPIHGTFVTNSSLSLATSNFPITANIFFENEETPVQSTPASGLSNTEAPRYTVLAATTNAGLNLSILQRPSSSPPPFPPTLHIIGTTSNGPAELLLQSPFEGSFDVSTSSTSHAEFLSQCGPEKDPLGLRRQPNVELTTSTKSRKEGRLYWGDLDDGHGLDRVELSTSNGSASLRIQ